MKKILILVVLSSMSLIKCMIISMPEIEFITMPDDATLREKLSALPHFIDNTSLVEGLASKKITPVKVGLLFEIAVAQYGVCLGSGEGKEVFEEFKKLKPAILGALLKDASPEALRELRGAGLGDPDKNLIDINSYKKQTKKIRRKKHK